MIRQDLKLQPPMASDATGRPLTGRKVLIIEDEHMVADAMADQLRQHGAEIVGPAATIPCAADLIARHPDIDAALVDVNLQGLYSFALADDLYKRGIRFAFLTGYDSGMIPERFAEVRRYQKPCSPHRVVSALESWLG